MAVVVAESDKVRILRHLGYPLVDTLAAINSGLPPIGLQTLYRIHEQIAAVKTQYVLDEVMRLLLVLDELEEKLICGVQLTEAEQLESMRPRADHLEVVYQERYRWACELASIIGGDVYPFAEKFERFLKRGRVNVSVCC